MSAFYNKPWVQEALGVPINFTISSTLITNLFFGITGDPMRRTLRDLELLLARGRRVALVYGDRDYRCNWLAAENVSLSISDPSFRAAGYAPIVTNTSYSGGLVRQAGNLSFSRVFQAGHHVAAYQPETAYRIFYRAMFGRDIATGEVHVTSTNYSSEGSGSAFGVKHEAPQSPEPVCLVTEALLACATNQVEALKAGTAVVVGDVVVEPRPGGGAGTGGGDGSPTTTPGAENKAGTVAIVLSTGAVAVWVVLVSVVLL
jgi:hypothetical protein